MSKLLISLVVGLILVGCSGGPEKVLVKETKTVVVMPPESLFTCPEVKDRIKDLDYSTDAGTSQYQSIIYTAYKSCKASNAAIKKFLENVKGDLQSDD